MKQPQVLTEHRIFEAVAKYLHANRFEKFTTANLVDLINVSNRRMRKVVLDYHIDPRNQDSRPIIDSVDGNSIWVAYRNRTWIPKHPTSNVTLYPFAKFNYQYSDIKFEDNRWFAV